MSEIDAHVEWLLRNAEVRIQGRPMTEEEAAHWFAADCAELREMDEEETE